MNFFATEGDFAHYKAYANVQSAMNESVSVHMDSTSWKPKKNIFLSHKHDELEELKGMIGFLEHEYNVKVYIDSFDPGMPSVTSGETAIRIKKKIDECDKFILLATEKAIASKWCNWELGYGDCKKTISKVAVFPIKSKDHAFTGNEYLQIYHHIVYEDGYSFYSNGSRIPKGYYIKYVNTNIIAPLNDWLNIY